MRKKKTKSLNTTNFFDSEFVGFILLSHGLQVFGDGCYPSADEKFLDQSLVAAVRKFCNSKLPDARRVVINVVCAHRGFLVKQKRYILWRAVVRYHSAI